MTKHISWEIRLKDGELVKSGDKKFNLFWFSKGEVRDFKVTTKEYAYELHLADIDNKLDIIRKEDIHEADLEKNEEHTYKVDLTSGKFKINEEEIEMLKGNLGDFSLRYFIKNIINFAADGSEIEHIRIPFIGYECEGREILYNPDTGFEANGDEQVDG